MFESYNKVSKRIDSLKTSKKPLLTQALKPFTGVIFFFLFEYFYYKIITKDKVAGMKIILFTDTFIFAIVIYIILVLIYMIGVI